jgi:hypothetical protein
MNGGRRGGLSCTSLRETNENIVRLWFGTMVVTH